MFFKYLFFSSFYFLLEDRKHTNRLLFLKKNKRFAEYLLMLN